MSRPCIESVRRRGVSLVEMLMVVLLLGIIVGMVVPQFDPGIADQLQSAANVLTADIDYARGLAISNNSLYSITFEQSENRYFVYYSGTNAALESLPKSAFLNDDSDATYGMRQIADFDELLGMGAPVRLHATRRQSTQGAVTSVEFGPLGSTTLNDYTVIWLSCGEDRSRRYLSVTISPVTGLATVGDIVSTAP